MKKGIITSLLLLLFASGFSQNMNYEVRGKEYPLTKKEKLDQAQFMRDIIPYYPSAWILGYVSVEISATCNGVDKTAKSANDSLSAEQKNILKSVDLGSDVAIKIEYKSKNAVTDEMHTSTLKYSTTIVPEIEAEYPSGYEQLTQYIKESTKIRISEPGSKQFQFAKIKFSVNEEGEIDNAWISQTSGDMKTDELLLQTIYNMPKWKPAQNSKGMKVRQEFEFSVGKGKKGTNGC
jgi:TonB family protein